MFQTESQTLELCQGSTNSKERRTVNSCSISKQEMARSSSPVRDTQPNKLLSVGSSPSVPILAKTLSMIDAQPRMILPISFSKQETVKSLVGAKCKLPIPEWRTASPHARGTDRGLKSKRRSNKSTELDVSIIHRDGSGRVSFGVLDYLIQGLIVLSMISFAVETLPNLSTSSRRVLELFEMTTIGIFSVEYVARVVFTRPQSSYAFSFLGIVDLVAIAPFYFSTGIDLRSVRAFRLLRLLRLIRLLKLTRYSAALKRFRIAFKLVREELSFWGCCANRALPFVCRNLLFRAPSPTRSFRLSFSRAVVVCRNSDKRRLRGHLPDHNSGKSFHILRANNRPRHRRCTDRAICLRPWPGTRGRTRIRIAFIQTETRNLE